MLLSYLAWQVSIGICQHSRQRAASRRLDDRRSLFGNVKGLAVGMSCVFCDSDAVTERSEVTSRGYRRLRCRARGRQFNERSAGVLNRTFLPNDVIAFVGLCQHSRRLRLGGTRVHDVASSVMAAGAVSG